MAKWKQVSEERYDEMLCVLPPALMTGSGFLVGEPSDHRTCAIKGYTAPTFAAFLHTGDIHSGSGRFFECDEAMTIAEFKAVKLMDVGAPRVEG